MPTIAPPLEPTDLLARLDRALHARLGLFDARHEGALRLCNGFLEGVPDLAIDLYGHTALIHDYSADADAPPPLVGAVAGWLHARLPWLRALVLKRRNAAAPEARRGVLLAGTTPDRWVREEGVRYALDLTAQRDAGFYLDTRGVRAWARQHLAGKTVLNTFAHTGSLGVAARAGGAQRVLHLDRNRAFLNVAKDSYVLNGFPIARGDFLAEDCFTAIARLRRAGTTFDCVFLDPPFYSATRGGTIDLVAAGDRPMNLVRPLVADGGWLVVINNALFLDGATWLGTLERLCADGYLRIETLIPVPEDCTGYPATRVGTPLVDPAPFNHATKIAVLRVRRKG